MDAGSIDHTQAPIDFSTPLVCDQLLSGGTTQRAIRLQGKVATREAVRFPGHSDLGRPIALRRRSHVEGWSLFSQMGRGKLGRAYRIWEQVMAQFQPQVPDRTL